MPRYSAVAPAALPRTEPSAVCTTGSRPDPWPGEAVEAAEPQPASVAAVRQATTAIRTRVLTILVFPSRASGTGRDAALPRSHAENILRSAANYQYFRAKSLLF